MLSITQREQAAVRRWPGLYIGLTFQQAELLSFIRERAAKGDNPSFEEMKDAMGLRSKSGIHRLISALVERGYVSRLENRARSIWPTAEPLTPTERGISVASTVDLIDELKKRGFRFKGKWA